MRMRVRVRVRVRVRDFATSRTNRVDTVAVARICHVDRAFMGAMKVPSLRRGVRRAGDEPFLLGAAHPRHGVRVRRQDEGALLGG